MLTDEVKKILTAAGEKLLIIAIGNTFRSDDGVGPYIAANLAGLPENIKLINAFDRPENIIDEAVSLRPDRVVIIDAANFSGGPGEARVIPADLIAHTTLSTHTFPVNIITKILEEDTGSKVYFLGIQAKSFDYGEKMSDEVRQTSCEIIKLICLQAN